MDLQQCYTQLHGDYDNAKMRLMKDSIIEKFLYKFLTDKTMDELLAAIAADDRDAIFKAAHTMKGVAANLGFTELKDTSSDLTEQMRTRNEPADTALIDNVKKAYQLIVDTIFKLKVEC